MVNSFERLSKPEKLAIERFVQKVYDKLIFQSHETEESLRAQADYTGWCNQMKELLASDPIRVQAIFDTESKAKDFPYKLLH